MNSLYWNLKNILVFFAVIALTGCASKADISSRKLDGYDYQPKRILIRGSFASVLKENSTIWQKEHDESDVFASLIVKSLSRCGITATYFKVDPLAVQDTEASVTAQFAPDAILKISIVSEIISRYMNEQIYPMEMIDKNTNKVVWKAELKFHHLMAGDAGKILTNTVLEKLRQDRLINSSCVNVEE